jgi:hypothetical protein
MSSGRPGHCQPDLVIANRIPFRQLTPILVKAFNLYLPFLGIPPNEFFPSFASIAGADGWICQLGEVRLEQRRSSHKIHMSERPNSTIERNFCVGMDDSGRNSQQYQMSILSFYEDEAKTPTYELVGCVPLESTTGEAQAKSLHRLLCSADELDLPAECIQALIMDNASSQMGVRSGAGVELAKLLGRQLTIVGCDEHVLQIMLNVFCDDLCGKKVVGSCHPIELVYQITYLVRRHYKSYSRLFPNESQASQLTSDVSGEIGVDSMGPPRQPLQPQTNTDSLIEGECPMQMTSDKPSGIDPDSQPEHVPSESTSNDCWDSVQPAGPLEVNVPFLACLDVAEDCISQGWMYCSYCKAC